jgi:hypothetical protein
LSNLCVLSGVATGTFASGEAWAIGGICPLPWDGVDCQVADAITGTTYDPCYTVAAGGDADAYCNFTDAYIGGGGTVMPNYVFMVSDYQTTSDLEAWGEVDGYLFCCPLDPPNGTILSATIYGSPNGDDLRMRWVDPASSTEYNELMCINEVHGGVLGDHIEGSNGQSDNLYGYDAVDTIRGWDGNDYFEGGDGDDTLHGGGGVDTMNGQAGSDTMLGGAGSDIMDGGTEVDYMSGGDDDDTMVGGSHGDIMCGDGHGSGDQLDDGDSAGEPAPDRLWGSNAGDEDDCGHSSTLWDGNATVNTCGGNPTISARPTLCP